MGHRARREGVRREGVGRSKGLNTPATPFQLPDSGPVVLEMTLPAHAVLFHTTDCTPGAAPPAPAAAAAAGTTAAHASRKSGARFTAAAELADRERMAMLMLGTGLV